MTEKEAIQQLEFDRAMILFNSLTGETMEPEMLKLFNEDNYKTYIADGLAIKALEEIQQYREIGTVEECREDREKQKSKKPVKDKYHHNCCPTCGWIVSYDEGWGEKYVPHCENCGQAIQRDENLEGMEDGK